MTTQSLAAFLKMCGGVLVATATLLAGFGYAIEKWNEAIPAIDFAGDIDQKAPFTTPLAVNDRSGIFRIREPRIRCFTLIHYGYGEGGPRRSEGFVSQPTCGWDKMADIEPNGVGTYTCNEPDRVQLRELDGSPIPFQGADMRVFLEYETAWFSRTITEDFVMSETPGGYHWFRGKRAGIPEPVFDWPAGPPPQCRHSSHQ